MSDTTAEILPTDSPQDQKNLTCHRNKNDKTYRQIGAVKSSYCKVSSSTTITSSDHKTL